MKRSAALLACLGIVCAVIAGDTFGAASSYPSPLNLLSATTGVTGSWDLDGSTGTVNTSTSNTPAKSDTGWYAFDPGAAVTTQLATIPTTTDGKGWLVDPVGGATGFPAGNWVFTVNTDIPGALVAGTAVLTVGVFKGTVSGSVFTATGTILTPTDDPAATDLRSSASALTTTVTFALPKFSIAAGETLFVDFWRHQTGGINSNTATERQLDFYVNDGVAKFTHPAADDTGPTHSFTFTAVTGNTYFSSNTVYYNGANVGSFKLNDAISDSSSGNFQVTYPAVATTGWTHSSENVTSSPSFQSSTYSWTAGSTTSPGAQTIVAEDLAQQTTNGTVTITNDTTAPTGQTVALSGGPGYSTLSVPLTLVNGSDGGSGLAAATAVVERATATLTDGTCGTFGSFATVTLSSNADATVATGNCYRYQYKISDNVANQSAASAASADAKVDTTAPTAANAAPTEVTGAGDQHFDSANDTVWFRPAGAGSFTLSGTGTDAQSGIASIAFPDVSATTGWTGSTGGTDSSSPFASPTTYTWTAAATAPGAKTITATNGSGLTGTKAITISADSTAPTGQAIALSGGPYYAGLSVPLTITAGTDAGAGIDSARAVVERASATLTNGVCGTFGTFAAVTLTAGADTTVQSGNCYRYQNKATDNVGNVTAASTASADAKVDATGPTTPTVTFSNATNAAADQGTVFIQPGGSGSFTITVSSSDTQSGLSTYTFPTIAGFAMTGTGASRTYAFTSTTVPPAAPQTILVTNGAGTASMAVTFSIEADDDAPTLTVKCNGTPCGSQAYKPPIQITITADDGDGAGLDQIRYTASGVDPTRSGGTEYTGGFAVDAETKIKARAWDKTGNASAVVLEVVKIAPTRLTFGVPANVTVAATKKYLETRLTTTQNITVTATMIGPGLKKAERWKFAVKPGAAKVKLRLPAKLRKGVYAVNWAVVSDKGTKAMRTTRVRVTATK